MKKVQFDEKVYIVLISIHGLIRGENLELGRDADTGGQTLYVVELLKALAQHEQVARVDLMTRQIFDPKIHEDYQNPEEKVVENGYIVRFPCGPRRYLRKESLWPYLDEFTDYALKYLHNLGYTPTVIHGHYADAGYIGSLMSRILGLPFIFTGHSLGRVKRERLLEKGMEAEKIAKTYRIHRRIEAEETALQTAERVITSTRQEIEEQYSKYHNDPKERAVIIPPGVDLSRFHPHRHDKFDPPFRKELLPFLRNMKKPMILAISRADERKNILSLIKAYGDDEELRKKANLVIVAGNRDDISSLDKGARRVLTQILLEIDKYDLYGSVAIPKHHQNEDVPDIYNLAAKSHGVFVNPALTEPFGLTLIEAAASGLPVVATNDGGPRDILEMCNHGYLIDPHDTNDIAEKINKVIGDLKKWHKLSKSGARGANRHYTWEGHVEHYLREIKRIYRKSKVYTQRTRNRSRMLKVDRFLITDIDNTLIGDVDDQGIRDLLSYINESETQIGFGIATGRHLESALEVLDDWNIPRPDILLTSVGTEIHYGETMFEDLSWSHHIDYRWNPDKIREVMEEIDGATLQPEENQRRFKISYYLDKDQSAWKRRLLRHMRKNNLSVQVVVSHGGLLDILPFRSSKGAAIRFLSLKWGIPAEQILVAGDSGNDEDMLRGNMLGVVVGNYSEELEYLKNSQRIYFAHDHYARGVLEGLRHYNFSGEISIPE
jgi:sucrose-phosphate synthase